MLLSSWGFVLSRRLLLEVLLHRLQALSVQVIDIHPHLLLDGINGGDSFVLQADPVDLVEELHCLELTVAFAHSAAGRFA